MRILFDSQSSVYKEPFGTLQEGQMCRLRLDIPVNVGAIGVECILELDGGGSIEIPLEKAQTQGDYAFWQGCFTLMPGLYFYYFRISKSVGSFRLFKQGHDTNIEAGDHWQLTCIPRDFVTPDWAKGAIIYQIFPDRFCRAGTCDSTGKLEPYTLHKAWNEEVRWEPDKNGAVLNNDFFGGNFRGIAEKMAYIASFGTTVLYLNPICKAFSSHRYDTCDYMTPDPMLGTEEDFQAMCQAAHQHGIKVVLDGVFSHTGSKSIYFESACSSPASPYYPWYTFRSYPRDYESWWGFDTLPTVNKAEPSFMDYIFGSDDSVIAHWLSRGVDGFRLDVADELPNAFLAGFKKRLRQIRPDALLMGEVWEDASNKVAYGIRKRYFTDGVLDSCMNYPFRAAILDFIKGQDDGQALRETVMTIAENYPPQVLACNMNLLGSHDTPRILTALVDDFVGNRDDLARRKLSPVQKELAKERFLMASFLQYTLPGAPSIYYGDEIGMEGHADPFNRRTFPWGQEDSELSAHFRALGKLRTDLSPLRLGDIRFFWAEGGQLGFYRSVGADCISIYANCSPDYRKIPENAIIFSHKLQGHFLAPGGFCIRKEQKEIWKKNTF